MKALVTGANGFTGSHLVKALNQQGIPVVGLVRQSSNLTSLSSCDIPLFYGDITDRDVLREAMTDVDTVFHTAAYVELGIVDQAEMHRVNVEGTRAVLEVAQSVGISKLVYCSTIGIFGDTKGQVVDETFQRTQTDFSSAYDQTKYAAQKLVDQFAQAGFPVVSLLPSGIFGADDPHFGPVIQLFLQGRLKLWVGGDRIIGIVHVDDLASAMLLAAQKGDLGAHYIISSGELTSREMFQVLGEATGIPQPHEVPKPLARLLGNLLTPIGHLLQWQPPISRERIHYIFDRCVRVDAAKAINELKWYPRTPSQTLLDIVHYLVNNS
jgi:nucleoside-diphosphate-sugar epimerase